MLSLQEAKAKLKRKNTERMKCYYLQHRKDKERHGFMKQNSMIWEQTKLWRWKNMVVNRFVYEYKRKKHKTGIKNVNSFRFLTKRYLEKFIFFKKNLIKSLYCALSKVRDTHRKVNELVKTYDDSML